MHCRTALARQGNSEEDTVSVPTGSPAGLGRVTAVKYNQSFLEGRTRFFSNEGVHILPVNQNHGPHQNFLCSSRGYCPVKNKHTSIYRALRPASRGVDRRMGAFHLEQPDILEARTSQPRGGRLS